MRLNVPVRNIAPHWNLQFRVELDGHAATSVREMHTPKQIAISQIAPSPRKTASTTPPLRRRPTPRGGPAWKSRTTRMEVWGAHYRGHAGQEGEWPRLERSARPGALLASRLAYGPSPAGPGVEDHTRSLGALSPSSRHRDLRVRGMAYGARRSEARWQPGPPSRLPDLPVAL